ncbi:MAG: hypothetical protein SF123_23270 [Chloroflexota bacterium]|nr:hypothetical protein [Chloroflexota bacterium]
MMTSQIPTLHYTSFVIKFELGHVARAIRTPQAGDVERIVSALGLKTSSVIFIIGGAAFMEDTSSSQIRDVIAHGLARFAQERRVTIIDGGTATGVMEVIGQARRQFNYSFPLIGVAPFNKISFPGHSGGERATPLEKNHSHFVLTEGDHFGDESDMITRLVRAISQNQRNHALGLIVNGGIIARHEAYVHTIESKPFKLLVFDGSGRLADDVAEAKKTGLVPRAKGMDLRELIEMTTITKSNDVNVFRISEGPNALYSRLQHELRGVTKQLFWSRD